MVKRGVRSRSNKSSKHPSHSVVYTKIGVAVLVVITLFAIVLYSSVDGNIAGQVGAQGPCFEHPDGTVLGDEICIEGALVPIVDACTDELGDLSCADERCERVADCQGEICARGQVVTWSYELVREQVELDNEVAPRRVSCCEPGQCTGNNGNCVDPGYRAHGSTLYCNLESNWLGCDLERLESITADETHMCDGAKWQTICGEESLFAFDDDRTHICNGEVYLDCDDVDERVQDGVGFACQNEVISYKEVACNDGVDNDLNDAVDCRDDACTELQDVTFHQNHDYQAVLVCPGAHVKLRSGGRLLDIEICDGDNIRTPESVTVCPRGGGEIVVQATPRFVGTNEPPRILNNNIAVLYDGITDEQIQTGIRKEVSFHMIRGLDRGVVQDFDLNVFAKNLIEGQQPMFKLDDEYYVLSLAGDRIGFREENLELRHFAEQLDSTAAELYPGTNAFVFRVLDDRLIQVRIDFETNRLVIQALSPGDVPQAFAKPQNLDEKLEVTFNATSPVRVTGVEGVGKLFICPSDEGLADLQEVQVCRDNLGPVLILRRNTLIRPALAADNPNAVLNDYLFFYEVVDGQKQVSILIVEDLDDSNEEDPGTIAHSAFIQAMTQGRRVGLEFDNDLYLLSHEGNQLSFPTIKATGFRANGSSTRFDAIGTSQDYVEFPTLNGGKMYLQRQYNDPPPPFKIWALEKNELAPIYLNETLSATLHSLGSITFGQPSSLGLVERRDDDLEQNSGFFEISTENPVNPNLDLPLDGPYPISLGAEGNVLFYYNNAAFDGGTPFKTAEIYLLYDLSAGRAFQTYDNEFITRLIGGGQIALFYEQLYYILSHENVEGEQAFFNIGNLRLTELGTDNTITPEMRDSKAHFELGEDGSQITIARSQLVDKLVFEASGFELPDAQALAGDNNSIVLTTENAVRFAEADFNICSQDVYHSVASADVCVSKNNVDSNHLIKGVNAEAVPGFVFELNGETGDAKEVTIRTLIDMDDTSVHEQAQWSDFIDHVLDGDYPIFRIDERLYAPRAESALLRTLSLEDLETNEVTDIRFVKDITAVTFNGTFILNDTTVFANQSIEGLVRDRSITTTFIKREDAFVPLRNGTLSFGLGVRDHADFRLKPNGEEYGLKVIRIINVPVEDDEDPIFMAQLSLERFVPNQANDLIFSNRFAVGQPRLLDLEGQRFVIYIESIEEGVVRVVLQRQSRE